MMECLLACARLKFIQSCEGIKEKVTEWGGQGEGGEDGSRKECMVGVVKHGL